MSDTKANPNSKTPAVPVAAATILLLRDRPQGLEAFMEYRGAKFYGQ